MKNLRLSELEFIVFDLETTGFYADSGDEIVEIGAISVSQNQITESQFHTMVNPKRPIPAAASAVSGIKDADVAKAPTLDQVIKKFNEFIGSKILIAQNAKFDMSFILFAYQKYQIPYRQNIVIDTMAISKLLFPYETYHNLDVIMARLGISKTGGRHRAIDDCRYTALAFLEFVKLLEKQGLSTLPQIEETFIKHENILKASKPKSMNLFR